MRTGAALAAKLRRTAKNLTGAGPLVAVTRPEKRNAGFGCRGAVQSLHLVVTRVQYFFRFFDVRQPTSTANALKPTGSTAVANIQKPGRALPVGCGENTGWLPSV
jgi:hypothetical protein